jgi:hypothetical protein
LSSDIAPAADRLSRSARLDADGVVAAQSLLIDATIIAPCCCRPLGGRRLLGNSPNLDHRSPSRMKSDPGEDLDGDYGRNDPINDHAEGRPPARVRDEVSPVLPQVLQPMARQSDDQQPRRTCNCGSSHDDEDGRNATFGRDDSRAPVGNSKSDVHGRNENQAERINRRVAEPPKRER